MTQTFPASRLLEVPCFTRPLRASPIKDRTYELGSIIPRPSHSVYHAEYCFALSSPTTHLNRLIPDLTIYGDAC
jgi:hypothetical protein